MARRVTLIFVALVMLIGGVLTAQHVVSAGGSPGLILSVLGGLALLGTGLGLVGMLGLRGRRLPREDVLVLAPGKASKTSGKPQV